MNPQSQTEWIRLLNNVENTERSSVLLYLGEDTRIERIKNVLMVIKASNEHSRSSFWNSGPKQHTQGAMNFLHKRLFRKERQRFLQYQHPVDIALLTKNSEHLNIIWELTRDKISIYNACSSAIQEYCKDESWSDYKMSKL